VDVTVSDDGLSITNKTRTGHVLYDGQVTRRLFQGEDGAWYVETRGTGNNAPAGLARVNQWAGPKIFDKVDEQMRRNIEAHHKRE